jgi:hypothetical protein
LDESLKTFQHISDISICLSDFEKIDIVCQNVVITENKMNFLTLPSLASTIAIWSGGGFNVSYLRNAGWLREKEIYYWGDIDEHGFQILHQIRSYYKQTKSVMMDKQTFSTFHSFAVKGEQNSVERLNLLNEDEAGLYELLKTMRANNRLEQEKIPQVYADAILANCIAS